MRNEGGRRDPTAFFFAFFASLSRLRYNQRDDCFCYLPLLLGKDSFHELISFLASRIPDGIPLSWLIA